MALNWTCLALPLGAIDQSITGVSQEMTTSGDVPTRALGHYIYRCDHGALLHLYNIHQMFGLDKANIGT